MEGHLVLESWDDKTTGQKRSKHKIVADSIQLLDTRAESEARQSRMGGAPSAPPRSDVGGYSSSSPPPDMHEEAPAAASGGTGEEIPF
jgi:single-strand DNA-binding protein